MWVFKANLDDRTLEMQQKLIGQYSVPHQFTLKLILKLQLDRMSYAGVKLAEYQVTLKNCSERVGECFFTPKFCNFFCQNNVFNPD